MKHFRKILWLIGTLGFAIWQCAQIAFPVAAVGATVLSANFNWLAWDRDGRARVYIALPIGTLLQDHPFRPTKTWAMNGVAIVEVIRTIHPGESITNMDDAHWRDWSARHKVCLRLGSTVQDIAAFAANRGCWWLHDKTGETFALITGPANIKAAWEDVEDKATKGGLTLAKAYITAIPAPDLVERQELEGIGAVVVDAITPQTAPASSPFTFAFAANPTVLMPGVLWVIFTLLIIWSNFWGGSDKGLVLQGAGD